MDPTLLGKKYDKIADWWHEQHDNSDYGIAQFERAVSLRSKGGTALDVGCGSGGRFVRILKNHDYEVTGLDVSAEMIRLASENHPQEYFILQDVCTWETTDRYDFIVAWDSIFHLPLDKHRAVIEKLCRLLAEDGVFIYTFGNASGEQTDIWHDDTYYYSSIGIDENVRILMESGLSVLHLELDQYPEKHVCVISKRT